MITNMTQELQKTSDEAQERVAVSSTRLVRPRYYAKEYARGHWHVIGPSGIPIYDGALYGNDKPVIFRDEDAALACAERCNNDDDGQVAQQRNERLPVAISGSKHADQSGGVAIT